MRDAAARTEARLRKSSVFIDLLIRQRNLGTFGVDQGEMHAPGLRALAAQENRFYASQDEIADGPSLSGGLFSELPVHSSRDIDGDADGFGLHNVITLAVPCGNSRTSRRAR